MRRKDRQMDKDFALKVIDESDYGSMAIAVDEKPLLRALSLARQGQILYFHSALEGEKMEAYRDGLEVELVFVSGVLVPDLYSRDEIKGLIEQGKESLLLSKVFTTEYSSAMVRGSLRRVIDDEEIKRALKLIAEKFTPDKLEFLDEAIELSMGKLAVFAIDMEVIEGKRKKFDQFGEEMKWGRMD